MGKSLALRIFIKTPVDQKNLKLGTVIAWTISKISVAIATCLAEFNFFSPYFLRVHTNSVCIGML